jgi:hypothetical protein
MNSELRNKLLNFEVTPPASAWEAITIGLDKKESGFASTLYEYELSPPASVWNNITDALDEKIHAEFPARLLNYEVTPPANAWQKIESALYEKAEALLVPLRNYDRTPIWKYAVAAAFIGLISFALIWMNNGTTDNISLNNQPAPPENIITNNQKPTQSQVENLSKKNPGNNNPRQLIASVNYNNNYRNRPLYASADFDEPSKTPVQLANTFSMNDLEERVQPLQYAPRDFSYDPSKIADSNPYVLFIGPDGSPVRVSKKLSGMIDCIYNDNTLGNQECKERLQQWREKIAKSPITPSPNNFMDMLDLIKSLQENHP